MPLSVDALDVRSLGCSFGTPPASLPNSPQDVSSALLVYNQERDADHLHDDDDDKPHPTIQAHYMSPQDLPYERSTAKGT